MRLERGSDTPLASIYYYDPTPWFLLFLAVSRRSGRAVPNELLTSDLGRWSTPTRPQLPDHPPPRHASSSARAPRRPGFGRYEQCRQHSGSMRYAMRRAHIHLGSTACRRLDMPHAALVRASECGGVRCE